MLEPAKPTTPRSRVLQHSAALHGWASVKRSCYPLSRPSRPCVRYGSPCYEAIGFGNALLEGPTLAAERAKLAREKQQCPQTAWQRVAGLFVARNGMSSMTNTVDFG